MYSDNQILSVSGEFSKLDATLRFALSLCGCDKQKLCYQKTDDGKFCIGWYYDEVSDGWNKFEFDYDDKIISLVIRQWLEKHPKQSYEFGDGSYSKGFFMDVIKNSFSDEWNGIKNPFYGIVYFESFNSYYSK